MFHALLLQQSLFLSFADIQTRCRYSETGGSVQTCAIVRPAGLTRRRKTAMQPHLTPLRRTLGQATTIGGLVKRANVSPPRNGLQPAPSAHTYGHFGGGHTSAAAVSTYPDSRTHWCSDHTPWSASHTLPACPASTHSHCCQARSLSQAQHRKPETKAVHAVSTAGGGR